MPTTPRATLVAPPAPDSTSAACRLALPKGRMQEGVLRLFADARVPVRLGARDYRPDLALEGFEAKLLKPQNIVEMLDAGSRDLGFAGADWVAELGADLVEVLDTGMDPVRIVAAAPPEVAARLEEPGRRWRVASEYAGLSRRWIEARGLDARLLRSFGATEAFPPEDADLVVDNSATGSTLAAQGLVVVEELMRSSTRLYANPRSLERPEVQERVDALALLLRSVLDARERVVLEMNVTGEALAGVCAALPAMREPTVAHLHGGQGYAVKAAVRRDELPRLVPLLKARGASDLVVTAPAQIVP